MNTVFFKNKPRLVGTGTIAGPKESEGVVGNYADKTLTDDMFGDKIDLATETLNIGLSIHPEHDSLLVVQSAAFMLQRMYNEAEDVLNKLDINNSDVKYQVAQIQYAKYHDDEKAERIWRTEMKTITIEELNNLTINQAVEELKDISWSHNLRSYASQQEIDELVKKHRVVFENQTVWVDSQYDKADVDAWLIEHDMVRAGYHCEVWDIDTEQRLAGSSIVKQQNSKERVADLEGFAQEFWDKLSCDRDEEYESDYYADYRTDPL